MPYEIVRIDGYYALSRNGHVVMHDLGAAQARYLKRILEMNELAPLPSSEIPVTGEGGAAAVKPTATPRERGNVRPARLRLSTIQTTKGPVVTSLKLHSSRTCFWQPVPSDLLRGRGRQ
jgi:hypothetical protein